MMEWTPFLSIWIYLPSDYYAALVMLYHLHLLLLLAYSALYLINPVVS